MSPHTLGELVSHAAARRPDAVAVVDGDRRCTYRELDDRSNRVAAVLTDLGVRRHDRVVIHAAKSLDTIAAIYGVLKLGAAYVPIDPAAPVKRARTITGACAPAAVVLDTARSDRVAELRIDVPKLPALVLDGPADGGGVAGQDAIERAPAGPPAVTPIGLDVAYILFTSGSTGVPKGVTLTHRNALAFVEWAAGECALTADDRLSSHAPLHFDLSVFDLYAACLVGARVVLVSAKAAKFPAAVKGFIEDHGITTWYSVPSILAMLVDRAKLAAGDCPSLRTVIFAGEVFPPRPLRDLMLALPGRRFLNWYGPTETNVCTAYEVTEPPTDLSVNIPIGRAITGVEAFAVDETGAPVAAGEVGELWVRGPTVMIGYWGDAERSAASLVPFGVPHLPDRAYRTGDLVEADTDGNWIYRGRRDHQIKLRGYRIELGDVEAAIASHPDVKECAVVLSSDKRGEPVLAAFVVGGVEGRDLVDHVAEALPSYMLPSEWHHLDALPRTSTDKIDRRALPPLSRD